MERLCSGKLLPKARLEMIFFTPVVAVEFRLKIDTVGGVTGYIGELDVQ